MPRAPARRADSSVRVVGAKRPRRRGRADRARTRPPSPFQYDSDIPADQAPLWRRRTRSARRRAQAPVWKRDRRPRPMRYNAGRSCPDTRLSRRPRVASATSYKTKRGRRACAIKHGQDSGRHRRRRDRSLHGLLLRAEGPAGHGHRAQSRGARRLLVRQRGHGGAQPLRAPRRTRGRDPRSQVDAGSGVALLHQAAPPPRPAGLGIPLLALGHPRARRAQRALAARPGPQEPRVLRGVRGGARERLRAREEGAPAPLQDRSTRSKRRPGPPSAAARWAFPPRCSTRSRRPGASQGCAWTSRDRSTIPRTATWRRIASCGAEAPARRPGGDVRLGHRGDGLPRRAARDSRQRRRAAATSAQTSTFCAGAPGRRASRASCVSICRFRPARDTASPSRSRASFPTLARSSRRPTWR